jgi:hypothetical protein
MEEPTEVRYPEPQFLVIVVEVELLDAVLLCVSVRLLEPWLITEVTVVSVLLGHVKVIATVKASLVLMV